MVGLEREVKRESVGWWWLRVGRGLRPSLRWGLARPSAPQREKIGWDCQDVCGGERLGLSGLVDGPSSTTQAAEAAVSCHWGRGIIIDAIDKRFDIPLWDRINYLYGARVAPMKGNR